MHLASGLAPGSRGGHGPIRYRVVEHVLGERVRFAFEPERLSRGLVGHHRFEVEPRPDGAVLRHVLDAEASGTAMLRWLLVLRPLHDALLEDALDLAERRVTGCASRPPRWGLWVRALRRVLGATRQRKSGPPGNDQNEGSEGALSRATSAPSDGRGDWT